MRTTLLLLGIVAAMVCAIATPTVAILGGWEPIANINNPHVQELAGWAVTEHDKRANDGLKFSKVVSGEEQVVSGTNYRFIVDVLSRGGKDATYQAVVYEQERTKTRKLISFNPVN